MGQDLGSELSTAHKPVIRMVSWCQLHSGSSIGVGDRQLRFARRTLSGAYLKLEAS